jgi:hypothetical protein
MTYDPLGPAERARQLDAIGERLDRQRADMGLLPPPTGDRWHDLDVLDNALTVIETAWDSAERESRSARSAAGPLPSREELAEVRRLEDRTAQLWSMRSRAIARRDNLLREPDGPLF